jgi:hypothetical protein
MSEIINLDFNHEYDFNFLKKLLDEASNKAGDGYKTIIIKPKFSEQNGSLKYLLIEIKSTYISGENNFNEH